MIIDEPVTPQTVEWVKKAIWQARNDPEKGVRIFSAMLAEHESLRNEIAAVLLRSAERQMLWDNQPMG